MFSSFLLFHSCASLFAGLFEQRVDQYLEELPDTEQSGVNKFLKGLGESCTRRLRFQWLEKVTSFITELHKQMVRIFLL